MKLGIRLLFVFFLLNGLAAFFVLRVFVVEIRPSVREVMEDMMVDTANILAELASDKANVARMVERFAGSSGPSALYRNTCEELRENRQQLAKAEKTLADLENELADIPRLAETTRPIDGLL